MAKTFLTATNDVLKRAGIIAGSSGELSSFTDTSRQRHIDKVIQIWNEVVHELYSLGVFQGEVATGTITLATSTREYALPSDFEQMSGDTYRTRKLVNTDNYTMHEYPGGYVAMFADQPDPSDFTGRPQFWAINEANDTIRVDSTPTSDENGDVYSFLYDKTITLSTTTDTFPFTDTVVVALTPVVAEIFMIKEENPTISRPSFLRALRIASQKNADKEWGFAYRR